MAKKQGFYAQISDKDNKVKKFTDNLKKNEDTEGKNQVSNHKLSP